MEYECRLCPSTSNLISVFGGKAKKHRQLLKEILFDAIGVKIEENDSISKCICCSCAIKIFNFYKFKTLSLERESILKGVKKGEKLISFKNGESKKNNGIQDLQDWLVDKRNKVLNNQNRNINRERTITQNSTIKLINNETQTQIHEFNGISTPNIKLINNETQTEIREFNENSTQTLKAECSNSESQTVCERVESGTQTNSDVCEQISQTEISYLAFNYEQDDKIKEAKTLSDTTDVTDSAYGASDSDLQVSLEKQQKNNNNVNKDNFIIPSMDSTMVLSKEKNIIVCKICSKILNNKIQYKTHLKRHMKCKFCNKKFRSAVQLENHKCENKIKNLPTVPLVRVDYHPEFKEYCKTVKIKPKPRNLFRSKSLSCLDNLQGNNVTALNIFFLKTVATGESKAIQTLPLHDTNILTSPKYNQKTKKI